MIARYAVALSAVTLALCPAPVRAGPCTQQIYDAQNTVDKRLDAIAAAGKTGNQSVFATMHRQPTPHSVASAEEKKSATYPRATSSRFAKTWMRRARPTTTAISPPA